MSNIGIVQKLSLSPSLAHGSQVLTFKNCYRGYNEREFSFSFLEYINQNKIKYLFCFYFVYDIDAWPLYRALIRCLIT